MKRAVLAARVGLLGDVELARAHQRALVVGLHGRAGGAVLPGGEAVLLLRGVDDLAAGEGGGGRGQHEGGRQDEGDASCVGSLLELLVVGHAPARPAPGAP